MNPGGLRVVVVSDAVRGLDSWDAGVALARGWAAGSRVVVVPVAEGGRPLGGALARLVRGDLEDRGDRWVMRAAGTLAVGLDQADVGPWAEGASSAELGRWLAACVARVPGPLTRVVIDLTGVRAHDGGAGFLGALGARADADLETGLPGLTGLTAADLTGVRRLLGGAEVIGVVTAAETGSPLLGLRGSIASRAFAARLDPARLLRADAILARWASVLGDDGEAPGAGAAGGAGLAILALGGRLVTGIDLCAELVHLSGTIEAADVVVAGCESFEVGDRGGSVVARAASWAEEHQRPCLVFALSCGISRREMRTFGVEAAFEVRPGGPDDLADALTASAARIAAGWVSAAVSPPVH